MRTPLEIQTAFSQTDQIRADKPFYLVGIGGAGMSGLAAMLKNRGIEVAGSDSTESPTTVSLRESGIPVRIGHSGEDVHTGCQVVLSDAIDLKTSPEVEAARSLGCDMFRRSQLLSWLLKGKKVIAVTGTHGKTTVTGMIGAGLRAAGMDPTIVVGAYVPEFGGSVVEGKGEYAVVEACEAYNAFLDLEPYIVVLTNLEPDHLDFHGTFESLKESVLEFVQRIPKGGCLFFPLGEEEAGEIAASFGLDRAVFYSLPVERLRPKLPGRHNLLNASAAIAVAQSVGADEEAAKAGVTNFRGAERRLQTLENGEVAVLDDYAHHPTEVEASLVALREEFFGRRLIVVFQPHLYSRTAQFIPEFAKALSLADVVFLTDIYPAREEPMPGISSARIAELVSKPCFYVPSRHLLPREVAKVVQKGDVVVGMGAGNISEFAPAFIAELNRYRGTEEPRDQGTKGKRIRGSRVEGRQKPAQSSFVNRYSSIRIAVVLGGDSAEREVSLHSGLAVLAALKAKGYDAFPIDVTDQLLGKGDLKLFTGSERPDLAFLATHGTNQEDGALQGLFELLHIPYTGSDLKASALAFDKQASKGIFEQNGLPVPRGQLVTSPDEPIQIDPPLVVKPNAQGSTVGLSFIRRRDRGTEGPRDQEEIDKEIREAIEKALRYDKAALVEDWLEGMEISVPVLGDRALPVVEIVPKAGPYDFANKYVPGATEEIVPARLSPEQTAKAQEFALRAHRVLGCQGATRTDMIVPEGNDPIVLETNTLPGLTSTSLLPNSAKAAGISFEDLVAWIVEDAMARAGVWA